MMNAMPRDMQAEVLTQIEQSDVDLHQKIKDQMFIFENLLQIDDTIVETEKLIASQQIAEKVFRDNWKKILGPDIV